MQPDLRYNRIYYISLQKFGLILLFEKLIEEFESDMYLFVFYSMIMVFLLACITTVLLLLTINLSLTNNTNAVH